MSWAARRRFIILLIIGAVVVAFLATVGVATFYEAPSCSDNKQNQDETGIDCGGACQYLCTEQKLSPTVLFTKAIKNGEGRVDVIAMVENKNADAAAKNVPYKVTLYGSDQTLIHETTGTLDLPPATRVPVFISGITSRKQGVVSAFLDISSSSPRWFPFSVDRRIIPTVSNVRHTGTALAPRVEAILLNSSVTTLSNVKVIALVHNAKGDIIAASSTLVPTIPAQGQATAIFVWNSSYSSTPASVEIVPITPLT